MASEASSQSHVKARFSIDRGGTFTDVYAEKFVFEDGSANKDQASNGGADTTRPVKVLERRVLKLLSEDPGNYSDAPREGIRRVLEEFFDTVSLKVIPMYKYNLSKRKPTFCWSMSKLSRTN